MNLRPTLLVILDGWGLAQPWGGNAITCAQTPTFNAIYRKCPRTSIIASGHDVGLPGNEMGNSEVGHLNMGAGKIVRQDVTIINEAIENGDFYTNDRLTNAINRCKADGSTMHLYGLISDGGVHSSIKHLFALIKLCNDNGLKNFKIHAITDGRDSDTLSAIEFLTKVEFLLKELGCGKIVSMVGRYYAMDRDNRWDRVKKAYDLCVLGTGKYYQDSLKAISDQYRQGRTDEFLEPSILTNEKNDLIKTGDTVIFFNFRSDRARQMSEALTKSEFSAFERVKVNITLLTFVPYGLELNGEKSVESVFEPEKIENTLGSYVAKLGLKQLHIAETEKYPHVTYFFNGNKENPEILEKRVLIPSVHVKTYDLSPEMSAEAIANSLVLEAKEFRHDFIVANFANADMVGHTGNFHATVKAIEFLDRQLEVVLRSFEDMAYSVAVTADHGNAEQMVNPITGSIDTEHTKNPVPFIVFNHNRKVVLRSGGRLSNVSPTVCKLMGIEPHESFDPSLIA